MSGDPSDSDSGLWLMLGTLVFLLCLLGAFLLARAE